MSFQVRAAAKSVTGNYRQNNEDRCFVDTEPHLYIVADGMGGQQAGEKASEMAVDQLVERLATRPHDTDPSPPDPERAPPAAGTEPGESLVARIQDAVVEANGEIMALSQLDFRYHSMGTTLVMALIAGRTAYVTGLGDSRAYLIRGRRIQQLTRDHTVAESLADAGAISRNDVRQHRYRNVLWKYLGTKEASVRPDVQRVRLRRGDRLLLASDGLTGVVADKEIYAAVDRYKVPDDAVEHLVQLALENDSHDNVTCLAIYVD